MRVPAAIVVLSALLAFSALKPVQAQEPARAAANDHDTVSIAAGESSFDPNQPIKPGFGLSVTVTSAAGPEQDLTGVFQTDPTGSIMMKLLGSVSLRGLTPSQAGDKIAAQLKPYIKDPKATVAIVSVPKPIVFLSGGVTRSGAIPVNDGTTLAELLTVMGFGDNADLSRVRVVHKDEDGKRTTKEYNFIKWLKPNPGEAADEAQNPALADKDFVFVPLKALPGTGNATVEGDVVKPGLVPVRVGVPITLREALSLAGGLNPTADRREVSIRRLGIERPILVDYDKAEANEPVNNVTILPDDIVYVQRLADDKYINLNGAFIRPGKLPFSKPITLTQAISDAGGLTPTAKLKECRVFRHVVGGDPTRTQVIAFNYTKIRTNKEPDITLQPGDTIEVPIGEGPRPSLDPLQFTSSLLSIALIVDRLFSGRTTTY